MQWVESASKAADNCFKMRPALLGKESPIRVKRITNLCETPPLAFAIVNQLQLLTQSIDHQTATY
jgi:hypothetical protein